VTPRAATPPERARLFIALDLPADVCTELERWRSGILDGLPGLRAVGPEALHATLCFLGWRVVDEIEPIADACVNAVGGAEPPGLSLGGALWLPARRPRVLAVALEDPSARLVELQSRLSATLSGGGWYAPEARPFLGHVTVARVSGRARVRPVELSRLEAIAFDARAVTLYRSRLERGGARYEALRTAELGS
jgi:2'-5' RNA ligase